MNDWKNPWGIPADELLSKWKPTIDLTASIFTWTSEYELAFLAEMASRSTSICEIGSYHGKSAKVMALANPKCTIVCIDPFVDDGCEEVFRENLKPQIGVGQVFIYKSTSDILSAGDWRRKFDGCFVDGSHMFGDVSMDIINLRPQLFPGSYLTGHDWRPNDMSDGINRAVLAQCGTPNVFNSIWWITT